jgi:hypothetical protein
VTGNYYQSTNLLWKSNECRRFLSAQDFLRCYRWRPLPLPLLLLLLLLLPLPLLLLLLLPLPLLRPESSSEGGSGAEVRPSTVRLAGTLHWHSD